MSPRSRFPQARPSAFHYHVTVVRGERSLNLALRPWVLHGTIAAAAILMAIVAIGVSYFSFRDDIVSAMMVRQTEMQYGYEDRLAAMRAQLDRVTSRQFLDQNTIEGRVHDLLSRQAQLETRASMISSLAEQAGLSEGTSTVAKTVAGKRPSNPGLNPLLSGPSSPTALPSEFSAYGPLPTAPQFPARRTPAPTPALEKPHPEGLELRTEREHPDQTTTFAEVANPDVPVPARLGALSTGLERIEREQTSTIARIGAAARERAGRLRALIAEVGLSSERLSLPKDKAVGGPFVPATDPNASVFEREYGRVQADIASGLRLNSLISYLPLRRPLPGAPEITSGYGNRIDPFINRLALHSGVDIRNEYGAPVRATAAGKVVSSGWSGGYGNMVEIDHGNGLTTRYGHLASMSVEEGQSVEAGAVIGRVGSTGRSTGPHLHYEVRIDGDAVDPMRFLRVAYRLALN